MRCSHVYEETAGSVMARVSGGHVVLRKSPVSHCSYFPQLVVVLVVVVVPFSFHTLQSKTVVFYFRFLVSVFLLLDVKCLLLVCAFG